MKIVISVCVVSLALSGCATIDVNQAVNAYNRCVDYSNEARTAGVSALFTSGVPEGLAKLGEINTKVELDCNAAIASSEQILKEQFTSLAPSVRGTALSLRAFSIDVMSDIRTNSLKDNRVVYEREIKDAVKTAITFHKSNEAFIGGNNLARLQSLHGRIDFRKARIESQSKSPDYTKIRGLVCSGISIFSEARKNTSDPLLKANMSLDQLSGTIWLIEAASLKQDIESAKSEAKYQACQAMRHAIAAIENLSGDTNDLFNSSNKAFFGTLQAGGMDNQPFTSKSKFDSHCKGVAKEERVCGKKTLTQ